jgi:acylphosphatase
VEAVAEGDAESLERFERALRRGPSRSRVEHVMIDEVEPSMAGTGFEIR